MRLHAARNPTISHGPARGPRPRRSMTREHEPVLAPELVALLAPEPGQTAVDCTFGAGGHARAGRRAPGPGGDADRDRPRPRRRRALRPLRRRGALPHPLRRRRLRVQDFVPCSGEGIRPDMVYMDLGMSSMQVDAWERGFSYSYDAPLDMRMDTRQSFSAADLVNEWPEARIAQVLRRFGEERYAGGIAREIVRRRPLSHHLRAGRRGQGRDAGLGPLRRRPPRQAQLPGDPDRRQRRARRARTRRCRWPGRCCRSAAASPRSPSTRSRTGR